MSLPVHKFLDGFRRGTLWVHASQHGHGNTAFLLSCCGYLQQQGRQVMLVLTPGNFDFEIPPGTEILAIDDFHNLKTSRSSDLRRIAVERDLGVIATTHVNKSGSRLANENYGIYRLTSLYDSDIERSSDIVTTGFLMKAPWNHRQNLLKLQFHKSRTQDLPESGFLQINPYKQEVAL